MGWHIKKETCTLRNLEERKLDRVDGQFDSSYQHWSTIEEKRMGGRGLDLSYATTRHPFCKTQQDGPNHCA